MLKGQAVFQSNGSGEWNQPASWFLISGTDADGVPDSNDDATILTSDITEITANEACNNLTIQGALTYGANRTLTVNGNLTMSGSSPEVIGDNANYELIVIGNLTVDEGTQANFDGQNIDISGTTFINGYLAFNDATGVKSFDDIIISSTGTWNNGVVAEDFIISGSITNNGTFTGCSNLIGCNYTFSNVSGSFSGSGTISMSDMIIESGASYSSSTTIVVTDEMIGDGAFVNGNGSSLELIGTGPFEVASFTANAPVNTVIYSGGSGVTIEPGDYYNLEIQKTSGVAAANSIINIGNDLTVGSGAFDINNTVTVSGDVDISGGILEANNIFSVNGNISVNGGEFTPNSASADVTILNDLLLLNSGLYDHNTGAVDIQGELNFQGGLVALSGGTLLVNDLVVASDQNFQLGALTFTHSGSSSIDGSITLTSNSAAYTFNDIEINSNGVWNVIAAANVTIDGNIAHNGITWTGCSNLACNYTFTSSSGSFSGGSEINLTDILINGSASYTNTGLLSVTDRITGTGSFINGDGGVLNYSGNNSAGANFDISSFTASTNGNTVIYSRAGDQQLRTTSDSENNYYNLTINTDAAGDDLTLADNVKIDNQLTLNTGDLILGTFNLTLEDGATISGGNSTSFIRIESTGRLRQNYGGVGANLSFPIGENNDYTPINSFTINSAMFGESPFIDFGIADAAHPNRDASNLLAGGDDDGVPATAYISRHWTLDANDISNANIGASYSYLNADVVGTETDLVGAVYRTPPGESFQDWLSKGTVNATNNTVTVSNVNGIGDLYAMDNTLNRLPVELIKFEANRVNTYVQLSWTTASEEGNSHFVVERSSDGNTFYKVKTVAGVGTTDDQQKYLLIDTSPFSGRSYYRLKQVDFDGDFTYSKVVAIEFQEKAVEFNVNVYPNPAQVNQRISINLPEGMTSSYPISLKLVNKMGQIVWSENYYDVSAKPIQFHLNKPGIYFLQIHYKDFRKIEKLIVQ